MVQLLLANGSDVNAADCMGHTPLHCVSEGRGQKDLMQGVIRLLVEAGADMTARDGDGKTARELAEARGVRMLDVQLLLELEQQQQQPAQQQQEQAQRQQLAQLQQEQQPQQQQPQQQRQQAQQRQAQQQQQQQQRGEAGALCLLFACTASYVAVSSRPTA